MASLATSATFLTTADQIQARSIWICLFGPTISLSYGFNTVVLGVDAFVTESILQMLLSFYSFPLHFSQLPVWQPISVGKHVFILANLSSSVCAACSHPCWPKRRQLQPRGSVGQWRDKETLTRACARGCVAETLPVLFCQLKHRVRCSAHQRESCCSTPGTIPPSSLKTTAWTWISVNMSVDLIVLVKGNYKHKGFVSADISSCSAPAITQQFTLRRLYCLHHFISRSVILSRIYLKLKVILFTWWCIYGSPGRTRGDTLALNLVGMISERRCLAPELLWGPDSSLPRLSLRRLIKILQKPTAGFN